MLVDKQLLGEICLARIESNSAFSINREGTQSHILIKYDQILLEANYSSLAASRFCFLAPKPKV